MDAFDISTVESSIIETNNLPNGNISNDESSWVIETTIEEPSSGDNPSEDHEQLDTASLSREKILINDPVAEQEIEDHSSYDMFFQTNWTPIQAIMKKREEEIAAKDAEEIQKISILREQAKNDLENWHRERQRQLEQTYSNHRSTQNNLEQNLTTSSSKSICDWSKVMQFIDRTDGKQMIKFKRDLTRMKECIINAKRMAEKKKT